MIAADPATYTVWMSVLLVRVPILLAFADSSWAFGSSPVRFAMSHPTLSATCTMSFNLCGITVPFRGISILSIIYKIPLAIVGFFCYLFHWRASLWFVVFGDLTIPLWLSFCFCFLLPMYYTPTNIFVYLYQCIFTSKLQYYVFLFLDLICVSRLTFLLVLHGKLG